MSSSLRIKALAVVIAASLGGMAVPTVWSQGVVSDGPSRSGAAQAATSKLYLIEFDEPGALHYDGGVGSLAATAPRITGDRLFNAQSVEVSAYVNYLETAVAGHIAAMNAGLGRQARVSHKYFYTHSGIAAELSEQEARDVARMPGVKSVVAEQFDELNTFRGPEFIGAGTVWNLPLPGGSTNRGAGVRIAILDSGANSAHPSFADDASCGFSVSNPKLVALSCATATGPGGACDGPNPQADAVSSSHGVHTAGIAGGNTLIAASTTPAPILPTPFTQMSGVAPCAGINSYKVCNESDGRCSTAHSASAVNNAIAAVSTGVKVLNFSISGGTSPWTTGDNDRNFLDAVNAGIFVAASAGNTSTTITNPVGQVNHRGPWTMTVANSYHDLNPAAKISIVAPTAVAGLQNIIMNKGSTTPEGSLLTANPIRSYPTNIAGCTDTGAFPASYFSGAIALVRRGATAPSTTACSFSEKITNAFNAGAVAVVVVNNQAGSISMDTTGAPSVPAYSVSSQAIADNLIAHLAANPTTSAATFDPSGRLPDKLNDGSLRGPTPGTLADLTKPDISGPGTSIYAPARTDDGSYIYLSGTSMSGPHLAGSGALVRAVRPSWTPMEVKSALQMTAKRNGWKDDGTVPWDADDAGSGRVDLTKATSAGLVMDETYANFLAANPSGGSINIKALNLPSVRNMACDPNCTFTRTVKSTLSATSTWNVSFDTTSGIAAVVTPATFTLAAGATQVLNITVTPGAYGPPLAAPNAPGFGYVVLTEAAAQSPAEHITVAVRGGRDGIFKDGFETGVVVNPDIVSFNGVNFTFPANGTGGSIQWINGTTCACDTTPYNFNVYSDTAGTALQFYFPAQTPAASFGAVASGSVYSVLAPGAVVGPSATFYAGTAAAATVNWRPGTNLDGYLGFRFYNTTTSAINYGYARITSTAPNGHPFRIVGYAYNKAGAAITISSIP